MFVGYEREHSLGNLEFLYRINDSRCHIQLVVERRRHPESAAAISEFELTTAIANQVNQFLTPAATSQQMPQHPSSQSLPH